MIIYDSLNNKVDRKQKKKQSSMHMKIHKKQSKQKQIIYLSKKIEFKKQSQTIETVIKDKEIEAKKKVILNLLKTHANLSDQLANTKEVYKQEKQVYEQKYSQLIQEHSTANSCVLKLKVRKYRLQAIQKPELRHYFGNQVKNYLRSWAEYNKHILARRLGGIDNLEIARRMLWRLEVLYYVKPQYQKIIYIKQIKVMNQNCKLQSAILCIKKPKQEKQKVLLQIYATSGKYFHITRLIDTSIMHSKITKKNPLQNLLISIKKKQILFLSQYFLDPRNVLKIERVLKICKFQMDVLREKKKLVLYKRLKITNIFESIYHIRGFEGLELEVLLSVKKKEVVREAQDSSSLYSNGMSRRMNKYGKEKALRQSQERVQTVYTLRCQTILQKDKQYRFCIQDDKILQNNDKNFSNFSETFKQNFLIQLLSKPPSSNEQQHQLIKDNHNNDYNNNNNNSSMDYGPPTADRKTKPKIVKVIDFEQYHNLRDIITVQSFIKMNLSRKKYQNQIALFKKNRLFDFCCQVENNMMISAYIKGEEVRFFVECLSLSSERRRQANQDLRYNKKYWYLAQQFMNSEEIMRIRQKYLIWEIEESISSCFEEVIKNYEKQQIRLNEMKPIKAINRLRKFFIKSFLKRKRKTNIIYIKKLEKQHGSLVLILRRSQYLKNITEAHLYYLAKSKKQKQRPQSNYLSKVLLQDSSNISNKRMRDSQKNESKGQKKKKISCQQNIELEEERKNQYRYHKISLFNQDASNLVRYFQNRANLCGGAHATTPAVDQQFYITEEYFLLKPLHLQFVNCQYKFLDRFGKINVNCEQIMNELQNLSMQRTGGIDSRVMQDKIRQRTLIKQRSMLKQSKKSTASITMQENEKCSQLNQWGQNEKKDVIFYSLYKNKKEIFCIQIFVITSTSTADKEKDKGHRFEQVHFQEISKKQVINFGLNIVYKIVALWLHQSGQFSHLDQLKFGKVYTELANHSIGADGLDCFMAADAIDDQSSSQDNKHDNDT